MRKTRTIPHLITIKCVRCGFNAKCSCGVKLSAPRGCNRAGMAYAKVYLWQAYVTHCETHGVEPIMHHDLHHLVSE